MKLIESVMSKELHKQVNNLYMNCISKSDMLDHLISIGLNGKDAMSMASTYSSSKYDYSVIPLHERMQRKTYHCNNGKVILIEV